MNRSFRLVWNAALGLWVVASEAAKGKTKSKTISSTKVSIKEKRAQKIAMTFLTAGAAIIAAPTWAVDVSSTPARGLWGEDNSWADPGTGNAKPADNDNVTVVAGSTITVTEDTANIQGLTVNGTLSLGAGNGAAGKLNVDTVSTGSNGKVTFNHTTADYAFSSKITGSGLVEVKAGTTVLSGTNNYSGGTTISGGTLSIAAQNNLGTGDLILSGGTLAVTGDTTLEKVVYLTADKTSTVSIASDKTVTASGVISGSGGSGALTKSGAGILILSNTSSNYSGTTTVTEGTLKAGAENAFSSSSDFVVNGGILDLGSKNQTVKSLAGTGGIVDLGTTDETKANLTVNDVTGDDNTFAGQIKGVGDLIKSGAGALKLTGDNKDHTGGTTVSDGTLSIAAQNNLGTGDLTLSGGTLAVTGETTLANAVTLTADKTSTVSIASEKSVTASGLISGTGALTKSGAGTLTLSNTSSDYSGATTVTEGTLKAGAAGAFSDKSNFVVNGGSLDLGSKNQTVKSLAGTGGIVDLGTTDETKANLTVNDVTGDDNTFAGQIKGVGDLIKSGAGALKLTGDNKDHTGGTTVSDGTLSIAAQNNLGTGDLTLSGGTLAVTGETTLANAVTLTADKTSTVSIASEKSVTASGLISGTGALTKSGAGTLTLSNTSSDYSGATTVTEGTLKAGAAGAFSDKSNFVVNGGSLDLGSKNQTVKSLAGTGGIVDLGTTDETKANLTVNDVTGDDNTFAGQIKGVGDLIKSGAGALKLTGDNKDHTGGTTISGGTLSIAAQKNLGTGDLTLSGGTLKVGDSTILSNKVVLAKDVTNTVNTDESRLVELSGIVSGDGSRTKSGAGILVLTGNNGYTGKTDVTAGTLQIGNGGTAGSIAGDVLVQDGAKLNFNRTDVFAFGGNITGAGDVFINSGTVSFAKGVSGTNSLTNKAILSIADGKTTSVGGNYTQEASGTLKIGASSLNSFGKLKVTKTATFAKDAKINVDVTKANTLAAGSMTKVVEAGKLESEGFVVKDNSALFDFSAVVDGDNVNLTVVQGTDDSSKDDSSKGNSDSSDNKVTLLKSVQNQNFTSSLGAASVLDKFVLGGTTGTGMDKVVTRLGQIKAGPNANAELSAAVAQTLPLLAGASSKASAGVMQSNSNVVAARQSSTTNGSSSGNASETGASSGDGFISDGHAWVKPVGSWAKQQTRHGISGYDASTYGIIGGMDGEVNDTTSIGFALSYMNTTLDGTGTSSTNRSDIDAYQAMFYGQRSLGENFHNLDVTWQAAIGVNKTEGKRDISFMSTKATSDYTSYTGNLNAGLGRTFAVNSDTRLTPSVRAAYSYIRDESYKESGADAVNLNVDGKTTDAFLLSLNGDLNQRINDSLSWAASAGVGYDFLNEASSSTSSFAGGGAAFITRGLESSPWVMNAGVGVNYALDDATEITVRYDLEGRTDFLSQTATAKFTWVF